MQSSSSSSTPTEPLAPPAKAPRDRVTDAAWRAILREASAPYRVQGSFAWHFAEGKLGRDPVFRGLIERGDFAGGARVLDLGCGRGLVASLLAAADALQARGEWPAAWPALPSAVRYTGIDLMPRDVARAERALGALPGRPRFQCGDISQLELPASDVVVMLDVLHYMDHMAQETVLRRVRDALRPRGRLLLRVGDMAERGGFTVSQWVDRLVVLLRGTHLPAHFGRPLSQWLASLDRLGFAVRQVPMSQGTPFANVLLVAELGSAAA